MLTVGMAAATLATIAAFAPATTPSANFKIDHHYSPKSGRTRTCC